MWELYTGSHAYAGTPRALLVRHQCPASPGGCHLLVPLTFFCLQASIASSLNTCDSMQCPVC